MKVFRVHPSTIKKVVNIELNGEFNYKAAHYAHSVIKSNSGGKADPMDLSHTWEKA